MGFYLFVGFAVTVLMVGMTAFMAAKVGEAEKLRGRMEKFSGKKNKDDVKDGGKAGNAYRKRKIQNKLKELEDNKRKGTGKTGLKLLILQAGFDFSPAKFWLCSLACGAVFAFLWTVTQGMGVGTYIVFGLMTLWYPRRWLKKKKDKRMKAFTAVFADAIDIIVRGIRSGLPVGECLKMIGREMSEPVGQEFRLIVEGQKLGLQIDEILDRSLERLPTDDFKFFAIVLSIQQQTGGNLAETLEKLSKVLRGRKKMKDKIQALSSEAKASAMIIGSLPFVMSGILKLVAPDYIGMLFDDPLGHIMIAGGLTWMGMGILVMKNMINFDY